MWLHAIFAILLAALLLWGITQLTFIDGVLFQILRVAIIIVTVLYVTNLVFGWPGGMPLR